MGREWLLSLRGGMLDLVIGTLAIYVGINVLGFLWTIATIHFGIPDSLRIQDRPHPWDTLWNRMPLILFNQLVLMTMTWVALSNFGHLFDMELPSVGVIILQLIAIHLLDDLLFYGWHRLLHENKWLYNKIHRIHHKAFSPLPIEYIYVHPLEWFVGSAGPFFGLVLVFGIWGSIPVATFWAYLILRNLHELDIHSGIHSPIGRLVPMYAAAEHHDLHHAKPTKGNYASTLTFWDRVLGTYWRPTEQ